MENIKCKNCKHYNQEDELHGNCNSDKFIAGYGIKYAEYGKDYLRNIAPDCVNVEGDEGWGFVVGRDFGCIHFKHKNPNIALAELINNNPDLPLEIAKRLEYKPDDTKNVDIEFDKRKFDEKEAYNSFVNGIIIQLQTGHIDFAKVIQELQNYKTY